MAFGHHPDFTLRDPRGTITTSEWFRRGMVINTGDIGPFWNLVHIFEDVFTNTIQEPIRMLIAGIADSQEPFSYLTTIKTIIKNKPIKDVLDLHIIDLQSCPDGGTLLDNSTYNNIPPEFAKDGFVYSPHHKFFFSTYRVTSELLMYLLNTYKNPSKSKWETRLQDEITKYPDNYFKFISVNNLLYYIPDDEIMPTYNNMCKKTEIGGYTITEQNCYAKNSEHKDNFKFCADGIYQKTGIL